MRTDDRLEQELARARRAAPVFGLGRQQRVIWGVRRRLQPVKFAARRLLVAAACLASLTAAYLIWSRPRAAELSGTQPRREERWELRDGSRVVMETPDTRITKPREVESEVVFELAAGAARFDVTPRRERVFRVRAGQVEVQVIGTAFRLERQGERTLVSVDRGRVRVRWSASSTELAAGERGLFPPVPDAAIVSEPASPPSQPPPLPSTPASAASSAAVVANPPHTASAEALFASADRARAGGRPLEAAQALRELTQHFPRDGRAPLAAFTLGRLLLENLHQPSDAARAFAQARALSGPGSALAEDALAREVQAWRAAGDAAEASQRAKLYLSLYPNGARLRQVLRASGLSAEH